MDRIRTILLGVGALAALALIIWGIVALFGNEEPQTDAQQQAQQTATQQPSGEQTGVPPAAAQAPVVVEEPGQQYVRQLAGIVVERFGTYSNHLPGSNIESIEVLLSPQGRTWIRQYTSRTNGGELSAYQGVTTRVASSEFTTWVPNQRATVLLHAHRVNETARGEEVTTLQDAEVTLSYSGGSWLVDRIEWTN